MINRSPFANVRVLLSSSTEFRFSIHTASTGPSNMIHMFSPFLFKVLRHKALKIPSVQSFVETSSLPNIWKSKIDLGFILTSLCGLFNIVNALSNVWIIFVLPLPVGPSIIIPCLTFCVSYN
eukprot:NODE_486_length_6930_cov_0.478846.p2 type:complete len:122 gc:universal NODE_486_length_6930_cov_0.478846:5093-5458(+)